MPARQCGAPTPSAEGPRSPLLAERTTGRHRSRYKRPFASNASVRRPAVTLVAMAIKPLRTEPPVSRSAVHRPVRTRRPGRFTTNHGIEAPGRTGCIPSSQCPTPRHPSARTPRGTGFNRQRISLFVHPQETRPQRQDRRLTPAKRPGGARRDRTDDLMLAKHALSQLSYGPSGPAGGAIAQLILPEPQAPARASARLARAIRRGGRSALRCLRHRADRTATTWAAAGQNTPEPKATQGRPAAAPYGASAKATDVAAGARGQTRIHLIDAAARRRSNGGPGKT